MSDSGDVIKVDQDHLETVIPAFGKCELQYTSVALKNKLTFRKWLQKFNIDVVSLLNQIWVVQCTSDWLKQISHVARPIRSTTQIWEMIVSMGFPHSSLRCHFAVKLLVMTLQNGAFFLRLNNYSALLLRA